MVRVNTKYKLKFAKEFLKTASDVLKDKGNIRINEFEGFCYTSQKTASDIDIIKDSGLDSIHEKREFLDKIRYRVMQDIFDIVKEMYPKYLSNGAKSQKSWRATGFWFASDENYAPRIQNYRRRIKALEKYINNLERGIKK